jgi:peptidoglycan/LPS O-acetylase OafA/YrhL
MAEQRHDSETQQLPLPDIKDNGRIEYIDALRGFTMLLVVFQHVATFCWNFHNKAGSINYYVLQVHLPLFFFISGFVLYRAGVTWNFKHIVRFFRKRAPVLLIAPFLFYLVFIHVSHIPFLESFTNKSKAGYWFTFVLLEFYVFYAAIRFLIRNEKWAGIILLLVGGVFYKNNIPLIYNNIPLPESVKGALSIIYWRFFLFFVIGTLVRKHIKLVERHLDKGGIVLTISLLLYFLINGFRTLIHVNRSVIELVLTLSALVFLFAFFRQKRAYLSKEHAIGRALQHIGRRTLDVYLIHYFLIPKQLSHFTVFTDYPMAIIADTCSLAISLLVIAMSLLIGNIIRLSPLLGHWLFGARISKSNISQTDVDSQPHQ